MKRYLVFMHPEYLPSGGVGDLFGAFNDLTVAKFTIIKFMLLGRAENYSCEILDTEKGEVIELYTDDCIVHMSDDELQQKRREGVSYFHPEVIKLAYDKKPYEPNNPYDYACRIRRFWNLRTDD